MIFLFWQCHRILLFCYLHLLGWLVNRPVILLSTYRFFLLFFQTNEWVMHGTQFAEGSWSSIRNFPEVCSIYVSFMKHWKLKVCYPNVHVFKDNMAFLRNHSSCWKIIPAQFVNRGARIPRAEIKVWTRAISK